MPNYTKTAVHGTLTVLIVSLLAAVFGYLVRLVLARSLSIEDFGLFYAVFAFLGLFGIFSTLGFDRALAKFIPEFLHEKKYGDLKKAVIYAWSVQLITGILIVAAAYVSADFLAKEYFHNEKAALVLILMSIAFLIDNFTQVIKFAFQGFKKMAYFSGIDLVRMVLLLGVILIGIKLNLGIFSAAAAYIVVPAILLAVFGFFLIRLLPEFQNQKFFFDKALFKKIFRYGVFAMAASFAGFVLWYTDTIMLTYFAGLASVALYSVALPTAKLFLYFPRAIGGIFLPLTSEFWARKEESLLKAGIETLYKYSAIIIVPAVFVVFSFSDLIISVFFGSSYAEASSALKILTIGMIFAAINGISANIFSGIGKPEINSKIIYSTAAFNFIGNIVLIPIWGINGAALTTTISYLMMMVMGLIDTRRFVAAKLPLAVWAKTLIAGLALVGIIWALKGALSMNIWLETSMILVISGACYVIMLFLFNIASLKEIKELYWKVIK